jgi:DNA-binding IclR family transcriptional regulator
MSVTKQEPDKVADVQTPLGAQAIHRALRVLECFSVDHPTVSLTEITHATGLTMPTAHRIVKALQSNHFVAHDELTARYSLGPALLRLAGVILRREENLGSVATPYLERLRDMTGETVGLHAAHNRDRVCLVEIVGSHAIRMATGVGQTYPIHAGAASKAILAFLPQERVDQALVEPLELVSTGQPVSAARLRRELARVRSTGYAISHGETVEGANALAAPVFGSRGVLGSVNITGPSSRWDDAAMAAAVPELLHIARQISEQFGYTGD